MQKQEKKMAYSEPVLVKHERLRDMATVLNGQLRPKLKDVLS